MREEDWGVFDERPDLITDEFDGFISTELI